MNYAASLSILVLTVGLALGRPRIGRLRLGHASAAVLGALLMVLSGIVPPGLVLRTLDR